MKKTLIILLGIITAVLLPLIVADVYEYFHPYRPEMNTRKRGRQ